MNFGQYLKDKWIYIFILFITFILAFMFMYAININIYAIVFIEMIFLFSLTIICVLDFYRKKLYYDDFLKGFNELEEKSYITEMINRPDFIEGRILYDSLKIESKYINDVISGYNNNFKEYQQYIETWVHEVKTPIATSKLLIENNKNIVTLSIYEEINKIENYVQQVLYVIKSDSVEKDYIIKNVFLKKLVIEVVKKKSKEMINKNIRPIIHDLDFYVLTDSKWIEFILEQIISNSIKYSEDNSIIEFYGEKNGKRISLFIKDKGIGIPAEDIPRIFQKGFTGSNGRKEKYSTGLGLYLCKKLCDKLEVGIEVLPNIKEGTIVRLAFNEEI